MILYNRIRFKVRKTVSCLERNERDGRKMSSWLTKYKKTIHLDFHMPEFPQGAMKNFDAEQLANNLSSAGVEAVFVFAKDHFGLSFYNTQIGHKHKGLDGDLLGELTEAAHKRNIRVLGYISVAWDQMATQTNPDWCQLKINGIKAEEGMPWGVACINSPYKDESLFPQLREICKNYDVDGIFMDIVMFQSNACYCPYCQRKYLLEYGEPMFEDNKLRNPLLHKKFLADSITTFVIEANSIIKSYNKDAILCCNSSWQMGQDKAIIDNSDLCIIEAQPGHVSFGGYNLLSFQCRYARNFGKPFEILTVRFSQGWGEMTLKETEQLKYEFSVIAANGGIVCCGDQINFDGTVEESVYKRIGVAFDYIEQRREAFGEGTVSLKQVAVLSPVISNYPYSVSDFNHSLLGVHKMLVELHYQYDIIDDACLDKLNEYSLLILPEDTILTDKLSASLYDFVSKGGNLIACSNSLFSSNNLICEELAGIRCVEPSNYESSYIRFKDDMINDKLPDFPVLIQGISYKVLPTTSKTIADLHFPITTPINPYRSFRGEIPPASKESFYPAICENQVGKGKVIYTATDIFKSYWETNHVWLKQVMQPVLSKAVINPAFKLDGYPSLELNMTENENGHYLHIVNFSSGKSAFGGYPMLEEIPTIREVPISIYTGDSKKIILIPDGKELKTRFSNGYTHVTVPEIDVYKVLKITD
jgi:hypothetical protein